MERKQDGSVEIERFRIINPPILVEDPAGDILQEWIEPLTEEVKSRLLKEDPALAIRETLIHNVSVIGKDGSNIIPGKVGNTTTTVYADTGGDGYAGEGGGAAWATVHDDTSAADVGSAGTTTILIADDQASGNYRIYRIFAPFDTSGIGSGQVVSSATFSIWFVSYSGAGHAAKTAEVGLTTQASSTALVAGDFDNWDELHQMTSGGQISLPATGGTGQYYDFTLNATAQGWIDVTGDTFLGVRYSEDADETTGHSSAPSGQSHRNFSSSDNTGTSQDPKLVVEHAAAPTGPAKLKTWNTIDKA
jgi:hypothetical protein